jgi:hypothetical protein
MLNEKASKVSERSYRMITITGYNHLLPKEEDAISHLDFIVKSHPTIHKNPFLLISRCSGSMSLTEKTARAFATEILKQCNILRIDKNKKD